MSSHSPAPVVIEATNASDEPLVFSVIIDWPCSKVTCPETCPVM